MLLLDKDIQVDPETTEDAVAFRVFNFDPTFAPAGQTAVVCVLTTYNHEYWRVAREGRGPLRGREGARGRRGHRGVREPVPESAGQGPGRGCRHPATIVHYTGNWRGSMEGWLYTPATGIRQLPCVLPGLGNFYMVGQWISPGGGLPAGLMTGKAVSKRIARDARVRWVLN